MHFQAKRVFWNKWVLWCALAVAVTLFLTNHRYSSIGIVISVIAVIAYISQNNYFYYLSEHELICKGGMFFNRIKLKQITGLRFSRHPFFILAPFKSLYRIRIRFIDTEGRSAYATLTPVKREEFMVELMKKCLNNQEE